MQTYRCWAEVDLDALRENLAWLRHRVGPQVKIMTVVKADAYGHGLKQIAALLMQSGTDVFGVANLAEAHAIRSVGRGWPILMLGACLPDEVAPAVRDGVMPTISSLDEARRFSAEALSHHKTVDVHLKVDTGMGRLGARPEDAVTLAKRVTQLPGLRLQGVFTHFSSAEDDAAFTRGQEACFRRVLLELARAGIAPLLIHASNSAALLHQPKSFHALVRPGLLVYGVVPIGGRRAAASLRKQLRPALSWKARVGFVKNVPAGAALSYGHTFVAPQAMRVATVTVGYGDGYPRAGSNRAEVLVRGRRCRVLGRVTMDQLLVDVSRVRRAKVGDEVVLIGRQGRSEITAHDLANWFGTIPWEVLTAITYRVPRIYRGGHAA
ncbi:MAG TPA: alanine racemase [Verrucomicrobiae bacterium]|jgi:alanine racemase